MEMKKEYTVLVINNVFEDDNLLIVKNSGEQRVIREREVFTEEYVQKYLEKHGLNPDTCKVVWVSEKKSLQIEEK